MLTVLFRFGNSHFLVSCMYLTWRKIIYVVNFSSQCIVNRKLNVNVRESMILKRKNLKTFSRHFVLLLLFIFVAHTQGGKIKIILLSSHLTEKSIYITKAYMYVFITHNCSLEISNICRYSPKFIFGSVTIARRNVFSCKAMQRDAQFYPQYYYRKKMNSKCIYSHKSTYTHNVYGKMNYINVSYVVCSHYI